MAELSDIEHLLRRTEFVARPGRVAELIGGTREAAVDNILDVPADAGTVTLSKPSNWERGEEYTHFWLNRMAHDSPRPVQERLSFFWHGHFCSDLSKVGDARLMQQQIDLFRSQGMGDLRTIAKTMSTQVAMIRYLDNNDNRRTSPNQNFGRELMELFLLGVGNYTEADVEASAAAWTGHTDNWETGAYVWRADWHDNANKTFLGRQINLAKTDTDQRLHGAEIIDTILGNGTVPVGPNTGRASRDVAAEFLSRKLWTFFAGSTPSAAVIEALRAVAVDNNFAIKPWLRALLTRPEFYEPASKQGLVRSPTDLVVTLLVASGKRSEAATPLWLMEGMGQRPLFPPNVSGWRHNGYFVNASAMAKRTDTAQTFTWRLLSTYWNDTGTDAGLIKLPAATLTRASITATPVPNTSAQDRANGRKLVDDLLAGMRLTVSTAAKSSLYAYAESVSRWERINVLLLIFLLPELHTA